MADQYQLTAEIGLDAYLLARLATGDGGLPDGRVWERAAADLLARPGLTRHQYAGLVTLFEAPSLSATPHEVDAAADGWRGCVILECKASAAPCKSDVAVFDLKTFDYFCEALETAQHQQWWRLLVSAAPLANGVRRLCMQLGIIACDPRRLPLPVLLRVAGRPSADQYLPEVQLAELLRLGELACTTMQQRWRPTADLDVIHRPIRCDREAWDDLMWLQDELSDDLLDLYDQYAPGRLESRTYQLASAIRTAAVAA